MTAPGPVVRPFEEADAAAVRAVVFGVLAEFGLTPDHHGTDVDLSDVGAHYLAGGGAFWVVEDGGRVVGTGGLWPDPEDPARSEVRKMYLLPEARGHGLGRRLLGMALDHARATGRRRVELETNHAMTTAIGMYERAGFREIPKGGACASRCERMYALNV